MKDSPPSLARATARVSLDTDCMMADTRGMLRAMGQSSVGRDAVGGGVAGYQQVLAEGVGRFRIVEGHSGILSFIECNGQFFD